MCPISGELPPSAGIGLDQTEVPDETYLDNPGCLAWQLFTCSCSRRRLRRWRIRQWRRFCWIEHQHHRLWLDFDDSGQQHDAEHASSLCRNRCARRLQSHQSDRQRGHRRPEKMSGPGKTQRRGCVFPSLPAAKLESQPSFISGPERNANRFIATHGENLPHDCVRGHRPAYDGDRRCDAAVECRLPPASGAAVAADYPTLKRAGEGLHA